MFPETRYHEYHLLVESGDVLVLYTDGVTEAESPSGVEFGRNRLVQAVKENYHKPAREIIALQLAVLEWTANAGASDDVTFFIIKALRRRVLIKKSRAKTQGAKVFLGYLCAFARENKLGVVPVKVC